MFDCYDHQKTKVDEMDELDIELENEAIALSAHEDNDA